MGWRDRDWAKFTPEEFDAIYGGGASTPRPSAGAGASRPRIGSAARIIAGSIVGFVALFGAMLATGHVRAPGSGGGVKPGLRLNLSPVAPSTTAAPSPDTTLVRIRWRPTDLAPAPYAGRICVTDDRHGKICASYVIGERAADALTRQVEALGLRVESSG